MAEVDSMAGKMPTPLFNLDRALGAKMDNAWFQTLRHPGCKSSGIGTAMRNRDHDFADATVSRDFRRLA